MSQSKYSEINKSGVVVAQYTVLIETPDLSRSLLIQTTLNFIKVFKTVSTSRWEDIRKLGGDWKRNPIFPETNN